MLFRSQRARAFLAFHGEESSFCGVVHRPMHPPSSPSSTRTDDRGRTIRRCARTANRPARQTLPRRVVERVRKHPPAPVHYGTPGITTPLPAPYRPPSTVANMNEPGGDWLTSTLAIRPLVSHGDCPRSRLHAPSTELAALPAAAVAYVIPGSTRRALCVLHEVLSGE